LKSALASSRKKNPCCRISMRCDGIYFEGLKVRGVVVPRTKDSIRKIYMVPKLSSLNDILGQRWYIRGLNDRGDFCYVNPSTVEFHLQPIPGKVGYQISTSGTLESSEFGAGYNLVFSFVREDGTFPQ